jgi:hypothetical protein
MPNGGTHRPIWPLVIILLIIVLIAWPSFHDHLIRDELRPLYKKIKLIMESNKNGKNMPASEGSGIQVQKISEYEAIVIVNIKSEREEISGKIIKLYLINIDSESGCFSDYSAENALDPDYIPKECRKSIHDARKYSKIFQ